jgi:hypothetical protein
MNSAVVQQRIPMELAGAFSLPGWMGLRSSNGHQMNCGRLITIIPTILCKQITRWAEISIVGRLGARH